jgi:signal transduction histidine kinase
MSEIILRGMNLAALAAALCYPHVGTVSLLQPLGALGAWLALSIASFALGWQRLRRWGDPVRRLALAGDIAVCYWAINWTALWSTELFLFALLPAALLGLSEGPVAGAAMGAGAALLEAAYARTGLWAPSLVLRSAALVFLPLAVALQAQELRAAAGQRSREIVNSLRSGQISEFLSLVLYQLREYLISVTAVAESLVLSVPKDQPALAERAERLKRVVSELNGKAGRLLGDKSDLITGRTTSENSAYDLNALVTEVVGEARGAFSAVSVKVRMTPAAAPASVRGDRRSLRLVLLSVLQNALESCSAQGGGTVSVLLRREEDRFHLMVSDDGCGLRGLTPQQVFEPIYCARHGGSGLGLGLPMSRRMIDRCGGSLDIRSRQGLTTALITLPMNRDLPVVRNEESTWAGRRRAAA